MYVDRGSKREAESSIYKGTALCESAGVGVELETMQFRKE